MPSKYIRRWLSEFKTIGTDEFSDYAAQVQQNEQLIDELYDIFDDDDLSPEVIDPICHQLFDFYRSLNIGLQRFTLEFIPLLLRIYLMATECDAVNDRKKFGGIEACILGIYNIEAASKDKESEVKKFMIPILARPSIYHEPPSLASMALTENALMHLHDDKELSFSTLAMPQVDSINSQNRLPVLTYVMNRYNAHIAFMSPRSHKMLCKLCSKLSKRGFDSLDAKNSPPRDGSQAPSSGHRGVTIADEPRIPLSPGCLIELLSAVYFTMFNGYVRVGLQALEDIHFRASYELYSDVLLITNAIRNSLQLNPSGQPKDGPMGISIMLSPAQGNPVFAKEAITNASFRAKKLPEDIDVQDGAGQLETSFHDDGSDGDVVISLRTSESSDKPKSSPLPKVGKGPLKSIMKKKEDKNKDRGYRKESDAAVALLSVGGARKGSHFKEFLEMHGAKSPKHSVSVSTGLSVSVNGDLGSDAGPALPVSIVRSSSSNRSVFEMADMAAAKDGGQSAAQASSFEGTGFSQDDALRGLRNGGTSRVQHSRVSNGAPPTTGNKDTLENQEGEGEGHIHTKL